jgi:hypothetical protein
METVLNLLWLVVTLTALWFWRFRWSASRRSQARVLPEVVAIGCALALLFPVISLTDDLHPEIVAVDAPSGKRNFCLVLAGSSHIPNLTHSSRVHSFVAIPPPNFQYAKWGIGRLLISDDDVQAASAICGACLGRSPPSLL